VTHILCLLKKNIGGHRFQTDGEVQESVSQGFRSQSPEVCADGIHSTATRCDIHIHGP
jgi:hypothetical protein